jgi:tetratricopeptide (TPR) repeat protein
MDPSYAPAWEAVGIRYYYDGHYGKGGEAMIERARSAYERALVLDPNLSFAAGQLVVIRVERGDLAKAYDQAKEALRRRPQSADAHFILSYVLRYAGMFEDSARECDEALALDPGNHTFRSCSWVFMGLGRSERAMDFLRPDAGSEWTNYAMPSVLLREDKIDEAREAVKKMSDNPYYHRDLLEACLQLRPAAELDGIAQKTQAAVMAENDPAPGYIQGAILAYCGKTDAAAQTIKSAIERNYCSNSGLQSDPLLANLRTTSQFAGLQSAAAECQRKFLAERSQVPR